MWFQDFFNNLINGGVIDWILLALIAILLCLLLSTLFNIVDKSGIKTKAQEVTVIGRNHTPTQTIMVTNNINGSLIMTPNVIPESWSLEVMDKRKHVMSCDVSQYEYLNVPSGTVLTGMVGYGRLTSYKYCTALITNL